MDEVRLTSDAIEVRFGAPGFGDKLERIRRVTGRRFYKRPDNHWRLPVSPWHAAELIRLFPEWEVPEGVHELAGQAEALRKASRRTASLGKHDRRLFGYQKACLDFLDLANGRAIIADDFGLGKTVEVLSWANEQSDIHRILVVCPANVTYQWLRACSVWIPRLQASIIEDTKSAIFDTPIHITSYNIMTTRKAELGPGRYDLFIPDEAHALKNWRPVVDGGRGSRRALAARYIAAGVRYLIPMSGSPFLNRPIELFPLLNLLDPVAWADRGAFGFAYCGGLNGISDTGLKGTFKGATRKPELAARLRTIMIRRTKDEVREQLPPLTRTIIPVRVDLKHYRQVYSAVKSALKKLNPKHKGYFYGALDQINALRLAIGLAKVPGAVDWATNFLEQSDESRKLVVYAHHKQVAEQISLALTRFGCVMITGDVSPKKRDILRQSFQAPGGPRALVMTAAGGEGVDLFGLNGAEISTILFVEREWVPASEEQAESRLHRRGQKHASSAYYLAAQGTVDTHLADFIDSKRADIKDLIGLPPIRTTIAAEMVHLIVNS